MRRFPGLECLRPHRLSLGPHLLHSLAASEFTDIITNVAHLSWPTREVREDMPVCHRTGALGRNMKPDEATKPTCLQAVGTSPHFSRLLCSGFSGTFQVFLASGDLPWSNRSSLHSSNHVGKDIPGRQMSHSVSRYTIEQPPRDNRQRSVQVSVV